MKIFGKEKTNSKCQSASAVFFRVEFEYGLFKAAGLPAEHGHAQCIVTYSAQPNGSRPY